MLKRTEITLLCIAIVLFLKYLPQFHVSTIAVQTVSLPADERIFSDKYDMRAVFWNKQYPVIVGGFGDSGTRAVWSLLKKLGVKMGSVISRQVRPDSKDSVIFMGTYLMHISEHVSLNLSSSHFYNEGLKSRNYKQEILYNDKSFKSKKFWHLGELFTSFLLQEIYHSHTANDHSNSSWGFKHPRALLMLPFLHSVLKDKLKVLHVIRDGREIALANFRNFYLTTCSQYYYKSENEGAVGHICDSTHSSRLKFWADLNTEILEYSNRNLHKSQYFLLKIEDIIRGDLNVLLKLAEFLGIRTLNKSIDSDFLREFMLHNASYFGNRFDAKQKKLINSITAQNFEITTAFKKFNYSVEI